MPAHTSQEGQAWTLLDMGLRHAKTRRLRERARLRFSDDPLEEMLHGFHTQPLTCDTEAGTMGRVFPAAQSPGVLEDLADRQVGKQAHRQYHPEHDLVGQGTSSRVDSARGRESLFNVLRADNLFQSRQTIQHSSRLSSLPRWACGRKGRYPCGIS